MMMIIIIIIMTIVTDKFMDRFFLTNHISCYYGSVLCFQYPYNGLRYIHFNSV
jgi:hypothetical protein